jgi:hypothetical protein
VSVVSNKTHARTQKDPRLGPFEIGKLGIFKHPIAPSGNRSANIELWHTLRPVGDKVWLWKRRWHSSSLPVA